MRINNLDLILTALSNALIAGLFYGYSCSVIPGLGKLNDLSYLQAMQSINREIQNGWFFTSFFGTLLLLIITGWIQHQAGSSSVVLWILGALVVYAVGVVLITAMGNVPLNDMLERHNLSGMTGPELSNLRKQFEVSWNKLHAIRTIASIVSFLLVLLSCLSGILR